MTSHPCDKCPVFQNSLFYNLTPKEIEFLHQNKVQKIHSKGDSIAECGKALEQVYCIKSGTLVAQIFTEDESSFILNLVTPSQAFGFYSVLSGKPNKLGLTAQTSVHLCEINAPAFKQLVRQNHELCALTFLRLAELVYTLKDRVLSLIQRTVTDRVAEALVTLLRVEGEHKWGRKDIARYAGTTVESVIRILGLFEKEELIKKTGREISIIDENKLLAYSRNKKL